VKITPFVRESLDQLRKLGDPQSSCDETNHGGLSVSVLQNSRGATSFPSQTNSAFLVPRSCPARHVRPSRCWTACWKTIASCAGESIPLNGTYHFSRAIEGDNLS
jgi:hypothetical protein